MKDFPIPVRAIGPGTQPDEEDARLDYLEMPTGMSTFQMPRLPESADNAAMAASRDVLARFLAELERWDPEREPQGPSTEMTGIEPAVLAITNQMLGEGEVSIQIGGERRFSIQESVFTGLWRCCELDAQGRLVRDWLEAAAVPRIALDAARAGAAATVAAPEWPPGAMNSPALVAEIGAQLAARKPGERAHVINLTLFPMTPDDHDVLAQVLPVGPVAMMSRGFGNCRVTSTSTRNVWRVQYFNAMNTIILNTIEVVDMPEVALASAEDLVDSRVRMAELVAWMSESCAEASGAPA